MNPASHRVREQLAAIEHERWCDWQRYMHSKFIGGERGIGSDVGYVLPALLVQQWERQIATPYADLTDAEKASDMEQVDRYWPLIEPLLRDEIPAPPSDRGEP